MNLQNYGEQDRIQYLSDILILVGVTFTSAIIFNVAGMSIASLLFDIPYNDAILYRLNFNNQQHINAVKLGNIISALGTWLFSAWFFLKIRNINFKKYIGIQLPRDRSQWVIATVIFISAVFISSYLLNLSSKIPFFVEMENNMGNSKTLELLQKMLIMKGPSDFAINLFTVALVPAITEEIFFRGLLQNWLSNSTNNAHLGVAITSLVFSAIHMNPTQFIPMVFLAAVLGYVYYLTQSIYCSILVHFFNNGLAVVAYYYKDHSNVAKSIVDDSYNPNILLVIASAIVLAGGFYLLQQLRNKLYHE